MVSVRPNMSMVELPPTDQRMPIKVMPVISEEKSPSTRSTGRSVASLASSAMRYSGA